MALLSTTHSLEGYNITHYHGIVTGEAIMGANLFRDLFAGISDIVGGRSGAYENVLEKGRDMALMELSENARARGANAVVGISFDYENIGKTGSMMMVAVTGTAVSVHSVSGATPEASSPSQKASPWT